MKVRIHVREYGQVDVTVLSVCLRRRVIPNNFTVLVKQSCKRYCELCIPSSLWFQEQRYNVIQKNFQRKCKTNDSTVVSVDIRSRNTPSRPIYFIHSCGRLRRGEINCVSPTLGTAKTKGIRKTLIRLYLTPKRVRESFLLWVASKRDEVYHQQRF